MNAGPAKTDSRSPTRRRTAKRDLLLNEAARQINDRGAGAIALNDVAEKVGLTRNALYYYVEDRIDLVFRCYLRSCEAMADDLAIAGDQGDGAVERLTLFVERALDYDRPTTAVLSDIDCLPASKREVIRAVYQRNVTTLESWLGEGAREGALRHCGHTMVAQSLMGMLSWVQLSAKWLAHRDGAKSRQRTARAIIDLILHGFAAAGTAPVSCPLDVEALTSRPFNAFDRQQAAEVKIDQLVAAASALFNRKGIDGVSLEEVSAAVGATKGAIYHYFNEKADLVLRCYDRAFDIYETIMAAAIATGPRAIDRALATFHLNIQAQAGPLSPMMLQPGFFALPDDERLKLVLRAQKLRQSSTRLLREGTKDGSCRDLDASYAAEVSAGVFFWLPKWSPASERSPTQVADEISAVFLDGIEQPRR